MNAPEDSLTRSDRRRYERINVDFPFVLRDLCNVKEKGSGEFFAENVSIGGIFFHAPSDFPFKKGEEISVDICPPETISSQFPFSRLIGRAKVARVDLSKSVSEKSKALDVGLEFDPAQMHYLLR